MVREAKIEAHVDGVTAHRFYDIVYSDPAPMKRYHAEANGCQHAVASPWLDGRRTVHFTIQLALPAAIQKIVGAGPIPVREVQTVSWDGTHGFSVLSEPEMTFPGAANFPTSAQLTVRDAAPCGVSLACLVRCSAGVPWVMQKTVEGIMAEQAKATLAAFLDFCKLVCKEKLSTAAAPVQPVTLIKLSPRSSASGAPPSAAAVVVDATGDGSGSESEAAASAGAAVERDAARAPATPRAPGGAPAAAFASRDSDATARAVGRSAAEAAAAAAAAAAPPAAGDYGTNHDESDEEEFFDASEGAAAWRRARGAGGARAAELLETLAARVGELAQAQATNNRLVQDMEARLRSVELELAKARAYQEGHAAAMQLCARGGAGGGASWGWSGALAVASTAVAASSITALLLLRRRGS